MKANTKPPNNYTKFILKTKTMDRSNSKANIKDKNLSFDDDQLNSIKRNLDKDDFNLINYLVDNEYSRLKDFQQTGKSL